MQMTLCKRLHPPCLVTILGIDARQRGSNIALSGIIMTLSEHIKEKRKKNGLSQVELAERAGVGLRFVRDLEQGKQTLRMDKVNDVLALFGERLSPIKTNVV